MYGASVLTAGIPGAARLRSHRAVSYRYPIPALCMTASKELSRLTCSAITVSAVLAKVCDNDVFRSGHRGQGLLTARFAARVQHHAVPLFDK